MMININKIATEIYLENAQPKLTSPEEYVYFIKNILNQFLDKICRHDNEEIEELIDNYRQLIKYKK